jgi:hypothetical protein
MTMELGTRKEQPTLQLDTKNNGRVHITKRWASIERILLDRQGEEQRQCTAKFSCTVSLWPAYV